MTAWCLVTAYDRSFGQIAERTVPAMRQYAERHGMDFSEHADCKIEPVAWSKLLLAGQKFSEGYEFVFWVDADAAIRRFDEDIRDQVTGAHDLYFAFEEGWSSLRPSTVRLNSGVFVWRNSPATLQFIDAVLSQREFLNHKWWDQSAIIAALGLWSHFDDEHHRPDCPTEFHQLLKRLPARWNCFMGCQANPDAVIRHFFAMDTRGKLLALEIDELLDRGPRDQKTEDDFKRLLHDRLWRLTLRPMNRTHQAKWRKMARQIRKLGRRIKAKLQTFGV